MKSNERDHPNIETTKSSSWGRFIVIIILAVAISLAFYFYLQNKKTQALLKNPNQVSEAEAKSLIEKVGILMELPSNEQPTIATVSDKTKLADQPFFKHAQNGDKVLIYTQSKKAILYRPAMNKIIEVAPINIADISPTQVLSPTVVTPTVKTKVKATSTKVEATPEASITP